MLKDEEIAKRVTEGEKHLYESLMREYNLRLFRKSAVMGFMHERCSV